MSAYTLPPPKVVLHPAFVRRDALAAFDVARSVMIRAFADLLASGQSPADAIEDVIGTASTMRQMVEMRDA